MVLGTQVKGVFVESPPAEFGEMSYAEEVAQLTGLLGRTALVQKRLVRAAIAAAEATPPLPPRLQLGERPARGYVPVLRELGHALLAKGAWRGLVKLELGENGLTARSAEGLAGAPQT